MQNHLTPRRTVHIYDTDSKHSANLVFRAVQIAAAYNDQTFGAFVVACLLNNEDVSTAVSELQDSDKERR
jgi:hypothetical protein